jgi:acyl-CoA synthetase (AMP-forming)/AMP-acid ligase II
MKATTDIRAIVEAVTAEIDRLAHSNGAFRITNDVIDGISFPVYANAPESLRAFYEACNRYVDKPFLIYGAERRTYGEVFRESKRFASALQTEFGIEKGDHVAIVMRNLPEWIIAFMAITRIGGVAVALNGWWEQEELAYAITDCEAKLVIADVERIKRIGARRSELDCRFIVVRSESRETDGIDLYQSLLSEATDARAEPVDISADDPATIFYTSGSSGRPKGVLSDQRAIIHALSAWNHVAEASKALPGSQVTHDGDQATLVSLPLFHVTGCLSLFLYSLISGRKLVFMHKWDVDDALRLMEAEGVTFLNGSPAMIRDFLSADLAAHDLSLLVTIGGSGAAMPAELVHRLQRALPLVVPQIGYGLTETNAIGTIQAADMYFEKPTSAGLVNRPIAEIRLVDTDGRDVPVGESGEILIKSIANFRAYWKDPALTAERLRHGWVYTGDIGRFDEDGFLYIIDRLKDIIIRGGENISSLEVESAIAELPEVREVAVFAVPDERLGEAVAAEIYLEPGESLTLEGLGRALAGRLAKFKIPERLRISGEPLPRTAAGKIAKLQLKQHFE